MDARRPRRPSAMHGPVYRKLSATLLQLRQEAGLTQREMAEELDEVHSFVGRVEKGERRVDAIELIRWCRACDADPVEVFEKVAKQVRSPKRRS